MTIWAVTWTLTSAPVVVYFVSAYLFLTPFPPSVNRGGLILSYVTSNMEKPLLSLTAALQTKVQRRGEDQNDWQHIHGCCWAEWDTWSREQSGKEIKLKKLMPHHHMSLINWLDDVFYQDKERQQAQIGIVVEFALAMIGKLDGINRHSFNNFRLRVGEDPWWQDDLFIE